METPTKSLAYKLAATSATFLIGCSIAGIIRGGTLEVLSRHWDAGRISDFWQALGGSLLVPLAMTPIHAFVLSRFRSLRALCSFGHYLVLGGLTAIVTGLALPLFFNLLLILSVLMARIPSNTIDARSDLLPAAIVASIVVPAVSTMLVCFLAKVTLDERNARRRFERR